MDYKEKYNKLVEAVKVLQEANPSDEGIQNWVNDNVPELCESVDEKIRKNITLCLEECVHSDIIRDYEKDDAIAWLAKQGTSYTKRDVDDAYVEGMAFVKDELEKQKPAWSDKDDSMFQSCIGAVATNDYYKGEEKEQIYDWLKSLKQRYTWKPRDEQMKALDSAIDEFDGYREFGALVSLKKDLEKLKGE